jgi:glycosyltransferase involved in cell wall biosynthesis
MRVMWVTPELPGPTNGGGSAHEYVLIRELSREHSIHVLSAYVDAEKLGGELRDIGVSVEEVRWSADIPGANNKWDTLMLLARARPTMDLAVMHDRLEPLTRAVAAAQERQRFDLVHGTLGEIAPALSAAVVPSSLLLFDSYTRHVDRKLEITDHWRRRLLYSMERRRAATWEKRWYTPVDSLASVSAVDADFFRAMLGREVEVMENPIGDEFFETPTVPRTTDTAAIIGSLSYPPNVDSVEWMAAGIWPTVKRSVPGAKLQVVGRSYNAPPIFVRARDAALGAGAEIAVDVPDIRPYYWGAAVVVANIRLGSGMRNKVLHAMACGAPVVATSVAIEGIGVRHREHLLVADDAEGLAAAIVESLEHPDAAEERARAAREAVRRFRTDITVAEFSAWWERTASGKAG